MSQMVDILFVLPIAGTPQSLTMRPRWPHVPRVGDHVQVAEGWGGHRVSTVEWGLGGRTAVVRLEPEDLEEHEADRLVELGWRRR